MKRRMISALAVVLMTAATLAACAPAAEISGDAASGLRASVQVVATAAAGNNPSAAVAELDALQAKLDAAVESGDVSKDRAATIQGKIDLVRADLTQRIAEAEAAAQAEADRVAAEQAAAEQAAAEQAAAEQVKVPPANGNKGDKGNNGKGNKN